MFIVFAVHNKTVVREVNVTTTDNKMHRNQLMRFEVYQVPKQGLNVPFRDGLLKHVAQDIFKLAKVGYEMPTSCPSLVPTNSERV